MLDARPPAKGKPAAPRMDSASDAQSGQAVEAAAVDAAPRRLNLALQGGGSHGAFTWGVLDRLLEEDDLAIEGISGTSAGAMNAAVVAHGMALGGREEARRLLGQFWDRIGRAADWNPVRRSPFDVLLGNWNIDASPAAMVADLAHRMTSPYQFNPMNISPLRDVLETVIDTDHIRNSPVKLFVSATNVHTGRIRVFDHTDVSVEALLASACLPTLFQAVEIDGAPHWDGGYIGNPALWPMIYGCDSPDIAVVQINPLVRDGTPRTAAEIVNRLNEISFNSSLMNEMRAISFVERLIAQDHLDGSAVERYKKMHVHRIHAEEEMRALGATSKLNAERAFLLHLHAVGRATAGRWLKEHGQDIGRRSTIDIRTTYL